MSLGLHSIVHFGSYYLESGIKKDSVEWIVMDEDEDSFLLVSKNILDSRPFDTWDPLKLDVDWERSEIRQWLNNEFLDALLSEEEKGIVRPHEFVVWPNNVPLKPDFKKVFGKDVGVKLDLSPIGKINSTMDRVSLLSWEEIRWLFPLRPTAHEIKTRKQMYDCLMKTYCDRNMNDVLLLKDDVAADINSLAALYLDREYKDYDHPPYWLRSPGSSSHAMAFAFRGVANRLGIEYNVVLGVRPIMWVSKERIQKIEETHS